MSLKIFNPSSTMHFAFPAIAAIVGLGGASIQLYQQFYGTNTVVVASSPADALIRINGKEAGRTPVSVELKRGTYTFEATRPGYEPAQHAVYVSEKDQNLVNIQLLPQQIQTVPVPAATQLNRAPVSDQNKRLLAEVEYLKEVLIKNPEEALSLPLLREKMRVQEELTKALREDLKEVKEQSKWYLGSMIAIVVGLLAVIATLFVGQRAKPNV